MFKNILIIVAHSDDETIGMGGTIKKHTLEGDNVFTVSMTDGVGSRSENNLKDKNERIEASVKASNILDFVWERRFDFADNQLDKYPILNLIRKIDQIKGKVKPNLVYSHAMKDLNIDHRIITEVVLTAFRPQPGEICNEIRLFEVPSATDYGHENITGTFLPNLFIDISKTWIFKEKALNAYSSEMREYPHSRSIESIQNLAKIRGNQVGISMAEAFQVIRKVEI